MASIAEASSLFEIDVELDGLLEEIEGQVESEGQASEDLVARFQQFCEAHGEKVDRIGRFVRIMEAREQYCRSESARLDRPGPRRGRQGGANQEHGALLPAQPGPQEDRRLPVHVARAEEQPGFRADYRRSRGTEVAYCRIDARIGGVLWETVLANLPDELGKMIESTVEESRPDTDTIKAAIQREEEVPGAVLRRGWHLRVK